MYHFSLFGIVILVGAFLICLVILYVLRRKIRSQKQSQVNVSLKKQGIFWIVAGSILAMTSIFFHIKFQLDLVNVRPKIFLPVAIWTSEPALLLTIVAFFVSLTILFVGIYAVRTR